MRHRTRYLPSGIITLAELIATAGPLYADDCNNTMLDCYPNLTIALLAALALALLIAAVWGMLVFGGWIGAPGFLPELTAEGAEIGAGVAQAGMEMDTAGAVDAEVAAAQARLESIASNVNPMYDPATGLGTKNCSWAAREVDEALADMFAGRTPEPYTPPWYEPGDFAPDAAIRGETSELADLATMESEYGSSFQQTSMDGIAQQLEAAGNGSRGIVYVTNGTDAHVFNAVNYGGDVFFVDGQTGEVWTSTDYLSGYGVNDDIRFMLTSG